MKKQIGRRNWGPERRDIQKRDNVPSDWSKMSLQENYKILGISKSMPLIHLIWIFDQIWDHWLELRSWNFYGIFLPWIHPKCKNIINWMLCSKGLAYKNEGFASWWIFQGTEFRMERALSSSYELQTKYVDEIKYKFQSQLFFF